MEFGRKRVVSIPQGLYRSHNTFQDFDGFVSPIIRQEIPVIQRERHIVTARRVIEVQEDGRLKLQKMKRRMMTRKSCVLPITPPQVLEVVEQPKARVRKIKVVKSAEPRYSSIPTRMITISNKVERPIQADVPEIKRVIFQNKEVVNSKLDDQEVIRLVEQAVIIQKVEKLIVTAPSTPKKVRRKSIASVAEEIKVLPRKPLDPKRAKEIADYIRNKKASEKRKIDEFKEKDKVAKKKIETELKKIDDIRQGQRAQQLLRRERNASRSPPRKVSQRVESVVPAAISAVVTPVALKVVSVASASAPVALTFQPIFRSQVAVKPLAEVSFASKIVTPPRASRQSARVVVQKAAVVREAKPKEVEKKKFDAYEEKINKLCESMIVVGERLETIVAQVQNEKKMKEKVEKESAREKSKLEDEKEDFAIQEKIRKLEMEIKELDEMEEKRNLEKIKARNYTEKLVRKAEKENTRKSNIKIEVESERNYKRVAAKDKNSIVDLFVRKLAGLTPIITKYSADMKEPVVVYPKVPDKQDAQTAASLAERFELELQYLLEIKEAHIKMVAYENSRREVYIQPKDLEIRVEKPKVLGSIPALDTRSADISAPERIENGSDSILISLKEAITAPVEEPHDLIKPAKEVEKVVEEVIVKKAVVLETEKVAMEVVEKSEVVQTKPVAVEEVEEAIEQPSRSRHKRAYQRTKKVSAPVETIVEPVQEIDEPLGEKESTSRSSSLISELIYQDLSSSLSDSLKEPPKGILDSKEDYESASFESLSSGFSSSFVAPEIPSFDSFQYNNDSVDMNISLLQRNITDFRNDLRMAVNEDPVPKQILNLLDPQQQPLELQMESDIVVEATRVEARPDLPSTKETAKEVVKEAAMVVKDPTEDLEESVSKMTNSIFKDLISDAFVLVRKSKVPPPPPARDKLTIKVFDLAKIESPATKVAPPPAILTSLPSASDMMVNLLTLFLGSGSHSSCPELPVAFLAPPMDQDLGPLLLDSLQEALFNQFERHRIYGRPNRPLYTKALIKPPPLTSKALIEGCRKTIASWAGYQDMFGANMDRMLIAAVKEEGKYLCEIRDDEVDVKLQMVDLIWDDLIGDTLNTLLSINGE